MKQTKLELKAPAERPATLNAMFKLLSKNAVTRIEFTEWVKARETKAALASANKAKRETLKEVAEEQSERLERNRSNY